MEHQHHPKSDKTSVWKRHPDTQARDEVPAYQPNSTTGVPASSILRLQRTIGNQAVMRMLHVNSARSIQRAPATNEEIDANLSADALLTRWNVSVGYIEKEVSKERANVNDYLGLAAHKALKPPKK